MKFLILLFLGLDTSFCYKFYLSIEPFHIRIPNVLQEKRPNKLRYFRRRNCSIPYSCKYVGRFNGLAIGNEIMVSRVENVLLKPAGPKVYFCYMTTEKTKKQKTLLLV